MWLIPSEYSFVLEGLKILKVRLPAGGYFLEGGNKITH